MHGCCSSHKIAYTQPSLLASKRQLVACAEPPPPPACLMAEWMFGDSSSFTVAGPHRIAPDFLLALAGALGLTQLYHAVGYPRCHDPAVISHHCNSRVADLAQSFWRFWHIDYALCRSWTFNRTADFRKLEAALRVGYKKFGRLGKDSEVPARA